MKASPGLSVCVGPWPGGGGGVSAQTPARPGALWCVSVRAELRNPRFPPVFERVRCVHGPGAEDGQAERRAWDCCEGGSASRTCTCARWVSPQPLRRGGGLQHPLSCPPVSRTDPEGSMELEDQWWTGQLAADIYQALRYKVGQDSGTLNTRWILCGPGLGAGVWGPGAVP